MTSDWHLDAVTAGVPRLPEFDEHFARVVAYAKGNPVDLIVVGGDYFDPGKMTAHKHTCFLLDYLRRLGEIAPTVAIAGNHDVVETSEGFTTLSPARAMKCRSLRCAELPEFFALGALGVLALPYVAFSLDPAIVRCAMASAIVEASVFPGPIVVVAHMTVPGARHGNESAEMSRGRDIDFPFDEVAKLNPAVVFQGHYHSPQVVEHPSGLKIRIPGSPLRLTFGDEEPGARGFLVAEV